MVQAIGISRLHYPVKALGPGKRIGIWFQGCSIRCNGCMSRDTWSAARQPTTLEAVGQRIIPWLQEADGVTISGGEPFDQAVALQGLLAMVHAGRHLPTLVYSGFAYERLRARHADILEAVDVLISEPFDRTAAERTLLRGSSNQRVHCLTAAGEAMWRQAEADGKHGSGAQFDLISEPDGQIWVAGVPAPGDLDRLNDRLGAAGIALSTSAGRLGRP